MELLKLLVTCAVLVNLCRGSDDDHVREERNLKLIDTKQKAFSKEQSSKKLKEKSILNTLLKQNIKQKPLQSTALPRHLLIRKNASAQKAPLRLIIMNKPKATTTTLISNDKENDIKVKIGVTEKNHPPQNEFFEIADSDENSFKIEDDFDLEEKENKTLHVEIPDCADSTVESQTSFILHEIPKNNTKIEKSHVIIVEPEKKPQVGIKEKNITEVKFPVEDTLKTVTSAVQSALEANATNSLNNKTLKIEPINNCETKHENNITIAKIVLPNVPSRDKHATVNIKKPCKPNKPICPELEENVYNATVEINVYPKTISSFVTDLGDKVVIKNSTYEEVIERIKCDTHSHKGETNRNLANHKSDYSPDTTYISLPYKYPDEEKIDINNIWDYKGKCYTSPERKERKPCNNYRDRIWRSWINTEIHIKSKGDNNQTDVIHHETIVEPKLCNKEEYKPKIECTVDTYPYPNIVSLDYGPVHNGCNGMYSYAQETPNTWCWHIPQYSNCYKPISSYSYYLPQYFC